MHTVTLSPEFRKALRERRNGRPHVFEDIDPQRTALLVIDMQNAFLAPGAPLEVPLARGIVGNINRLAARLRAMGSAVVWLRSTFAEEGPGRFDAYFDYFAPGDGEKLRADFHDGAKGHAFWHELDRFDTDLVISKNRFSAFIERTSVLDQQLHALGIDTLVVTGTLTNVCCESTVRDAMMLDYKCILIEDANAAQSDEEHLAALANVARVYGDVLTTTEFLNKFAR